MKKKNEPETCPVDLIPEVKHNLAYQPENNTNMLVSLKVVNKSPNKLPTRADNGSSGYDVRAWCRNENFMGDKAEWDDVNKSIRIFSGGRAAIPTGLYFEIPEGWELQVRPRSGLAIKNFVSVINTPGTIDASYRGEVCVILANFSDEPFEIHTGDRIAQLVLQKVETINFEEVDDLSTTERSDGGFGHSGIK